MPSAHQGQEREKKGQYKQRIKGIQLASFTLLVFSASGGMAKSTSVAYKRQASLLAEKQDQSYWPGYIADLVSLYSDLLSAKFIPIYLPLVLVRGRYPTLNDIKILS